LSSVQVLLATFNGGAYLDDLITSIRNQSDLDIVTILASDDDSTDNSKEILRNYGVTTLDGPANGAAANFHFLIANARGHEYYAFADQDDYWQPKKIITAITYLKTVDKPAVYVGSTIDTKGKLRIPKMYALPESLMTNQAQGCAIIFNSKFHNLLQENLPPRFMMHDWWVVLLGQCFGDILLDKEPYMTYRLHNNNLIGTDSKFLKAFRLLQKIKSGQHYVGVLNQANYLIETPIHNEKTLEIESWLEAVNGSLFARVKYLLRAKLNFKSLWKNIYFSFVILIGRYKLPRTKEEAKL
jgi:glycosyltransferase involved in cell wall biosynthesis